jgi:hypothetical protein
LDPEPASEPLEAWAQPLLEREFARLPGLYDRFHQVLLYVPTSRTAASFDAPRPFGDMVWSFASTAWSAAAGNALTWSQLTQVGIVPERGHYSLARAALEGAVLCRWLVDPDVRAKERRHRAARLWASDLRMRLCWENEWLEDLGDQAPRPDQFNASDQLTAHLAAMHVEGMPEGEAIKATHMMSKYAGSAWPYRALSAFAHGRPWSGILTSMARSVHDPGEPGVVLTRVMANPTITVVIAQRMMDTIEVAMAELERYRSAPLP